MYTQETKREDHSSCKTMRLLSGILKGCEFPITSSKTLVIVSDKMLQNSLTPVEDLPLDTIFLPVYGNGYNFEIIIDERNNITIRELTEKGSFEKKVVLNEIITVGNIHFAIKNENDIWSDKVLDLKYIQKNRKYNFITPVKKHYMIVYLVIATLMMTTIAVSISFYNNESNYMRRLSQMLANRDLLFSEGRDHILYVIAQDHRKAIWANQVIERGDFSASRVKVISPEHENQRIYFWLADNFPSLRYFRIQIGRSLIPILLVSKQRKNLTEKEMQNFKKKIMEYMPYIEDIKIVEIDDVQLVNEAEQGLQSIGIKYTKKHVGDFYSYNINGQLNDSEILRLKYFINEFYRQWGREYIIFNVALESDLLKDKSYIFGDVNFVKKSSYDWHFINKTSEQEN